ncbi:MAG: hypothetical protein HZA04_01175 [Nitrospinae bacterium]|nr:hypothetical protein [Nitrospinota bacterium]
MTMEEVREFGKTIGILSVSKFSRKMELIRTIQLANGEEDCFMSPLPCSKTRCIWRDECQDRSDGGEQA